MQGGRVVTTMGTVQAALCMPDCAHSPLLGAPVDKVDKVLGLLRVSTNPYEPFTISPVN